jgi:hypothetical protein
MIRRNSSEDILKHYWKEIDKTIFGESSREGLGEEYHTETTKSESRSSFTSMGSCLNSPSGKGMNVLSRVNSSTPASTSANSANSSAHKNAHTHVCRRTTRTTSGIVANNENQTPNPNTTNKNSQINQTNQNRNVMNEPTLMNQDEKPFICFGIGNEKMNEQHNEPTLNTINLNQFNDLPQNQMQNQIQDSFQLNLKKDRAYSCFNSNFQIPSQSIYSADDICTQYTNYVNTKDSKLTSDSESSHLDCQYVILFYKTVLGKNYGTILQVLNLMKIQPPNYQCSNHRVLIREIL